MKLMLVMYFCSALANDCQAPHVMPETYNDYNTCMTAGYESALRKTKEVGKEDINKYMIFIKFTCKQDTRIAT